MRKKKVKNIKCVTDFDVSGLKCCCALRIADTKTYVSKKTRVEMKVEHIWQMLAPCRRAYLIDKSTKSNAKNLSNI